jgi:transglutaminase-like putative cysteine protease
MHEGKMVWHLFTDMTNQFVHEIDVFPPARVLEKAERNMVALMKVPELSSGESFSPSVVLRIDTTSRDWLMESQPTPENVIARVRGTYSGMQRYWETDDTTVQEMCGDIAERSKDDESYARLAVEAVRERVKLKTNLEDRRGAARAAREKEGDCDEHADLFIALTRAAKIPSRRVVGHFLTNGPNPEPHAWCEVFLRDHGWVPVDPALNRFGILTESYFSRVREGLTSERPTIQLKWNTVGANIPVIEETVKMSVV